MTDTIEQKALALVNAVEADRSLPQHTIGINREYTGDEALCRAIEQHEAFRQEVSDALLRYHALSHVPHGLQAFIIAKPDPLVEAWQLAFPGNHIEDARDECAKISAAIEKRGGKIVWGEG